MVTQHRCGAPSANTLTPRKTSPRCAWGWRGWRRPRATRRLACPYGSLSRLRHERAACGVDYRRPRAGAAWGSSYGCLPGTLLGQKPGYCDQDYDEGKCSPAVWLLNTMNFTMPGQFAINAQEGNVYYWPALASGDVGGVSLPATTSLVRLEGSATTTTTTTTSIRPAQHITFSGLTFTHADRKPLSPDDAGGIQHNWAASRATMPWSRWAGVRNITWSACRFENSGGAGCAWTVTRSASP